MELKNLIKDCRDKNSQKSDSDEVNVNVSMHDCVNVAATNLSAKRDEINTTKFSKIVFKLFVIRIVIVLPSGQQLQNTDVQKYSLYNIITN